MRMAELFGPKDKEKGSQGSSNIGRPLPGTQVSPPERPPSNPGVAWNVFPRQPAKQLPGPRTEGPRRRRRRMAALGQICQLHARSVAGSPRLTLCCPRSSGLDPFPDAPVTVTPGPAPPTTAGHPGTKSKLTRVLPMSSVQSLCPMINPVLQAWFSSLEWDYRAPWSHTLSNPGHPSADMSLHPSSLGDPVTAPLLTGRPNSFLPTPEVQTACTSQSLRQHSGRETDHGEHVTKG